MYRSLDRVRADANLLQILEAAHAPHSLRALRT
jgi:hypothetical protein